jgi:hypothetical protein
MLTSKSLAKLPSKYLRPPKQILLLFISTLLGLTAAFSLLLQSASLSQAAAPMTDTLDNNVNFVSASDGGQHNVGAVTWNVGTLPLSQTITRTLQVTVNNVSDGTILTNTVQVTSTEGISYTSIATTTVLKSPSSITGVYFPVILK